MSNSTNFIEMNIDSSKLSTKSGQKPKPLSTMSKQDHFSEKSSDSSKLSRPDRKYSVIAADKRLQFGARNTAREAKLLAAEQLASPNVKHTSRRHAPLATRPQTMNRLQISSRGLGRPPPYPVGYVQPVAPVTPLPDVSDSVHPHRIVRSTDVSSFTNREYSSPYPPPRLVEGPLEPSSWPVRMELPSMAAPHDPLSTLTGLRPPPNSGFEGNVLRKTDDRRIPWHMFPQASADRMKMIIADFRSKQEVWAAAADRRKVGYRKNAHKVLLVSRGMQVLLQRGEHAVRAFYPKKDKLANFLRSCYVFQGTTTYHPEPIPSSRPTISDIPVLRRSKQYSPTVVSAEFQMATAPGVNFDPLSVIDGSIKMFVNLEDVLMKAHLEGHTKITMDDVTKVTVPFMRSYSALSLMGDGLTFSQWMNVLSLFASDTQVVGLTVLRGINYFGREFIWNVLLTEKVRLNLTRMDLAREMVAAGIKLDNNTVEYAKVTEKLYNAGQPLYPNEHERPPLVFQAGVANPIFGLDNPESATEDDALSTRFFEALGMIPFSMLSHSAVLRDFMEMLSCFSFKGVLSSLGFTLDNSVILRCYRSILSVLKRDGVNDPTMTFFTKLSRVVTTFASRVKLAWERRDIMVLFSGELNLTEWIECVNYACKDPSLRRNIANVALTTHYNAQRKAGLVPTRYTDQLEPDQWLAELRELKAKGLRFATNYHDDFVLIRHVTMCNSLLDDTIRSGELAQPMGGVRVTPFSITLVGKPNVGKSVLCNALHSAMGASLGYTLTPADMLRLQQGTNFFDRSTGNQFTCWMDDMDSKKAPITYASDTHVDHINKFINVAPLDLEKAKVEEKGTVSANFALVLYTTNNADLAVKGYTTNPQMVYRRLNYYVEVTIKPEFATPGGDLDRAKISDYLVTPDFQTFTLKEYDSSLYREETKFQVMPYKIVRIFETRQEFFAYTATRFKAHFYRETMMTRQVNKVVSHEERCQTCYMSVSEHPSGEVCQLTVPIRQSIFHPQFQMSPKDAAAGAWLSVIGLGALFGLPLFVIVSIILITIWSQFPGLFDHVSRYFDVYARSYAITFLYYLSPPAWAWLLGELRDRAPKLWKMAVQFYESNLTKAARAFHSLHSRISLKHVTLLVIATSVASAVYYKYSEQIREKFGLSLQSDTNDYIEAVYRTYRRPPGLPTGSTPYRREVKRELYEEPAYGIRARKPTFTLDEFLRRIRSRMVKLTTDYGSVYGFRLQGALVLSVSHIFRADVATAEFDLDSVRSTVELPLPTRITVTSGSNPYTIVGLTGRVMKIPGKDAAVLYAPELPPIKDNWSLLDYFSMTHGTHSVVDESWLVGALDSIDSHIPRGAVYRSAEPLMFDGNPAKLLNDVWQYELSTVNGDCGRVLVNRVGAHYTLAGVHFLSFYCNDGSRCVASEPLLKSELSLVCDAFRTFGAQYEVQMDVMQVNGHAETLSLGPLPSKSSLRVALSDPEDPPIVDVLGTLLDVRFGQTNRSTVVDTKFRRHYRVKDLERSIDSTYPYFASPNFRGAMEGAGEVRRWIDPYTKNLESGCNKSGDLSVWMVALTDYLSGSVGLRQNMRMQPLSDYDAFLGVEDTVLGGTNMNSSAGPPFYTKKKAVIDVSFPEDGPPLVNWDEGFENHLRAIESSIKMGDLYSPFCLHVLKDEVVTVKRNGDHKIRVFNILPFAFNLLMKKYLGPLTTHMRHHMYFYESAVGMNITSRTECSDLYKHLSVHNSWIAFDKSAFDTRCSTIEHMVVCMFFRELALDCGYTLDDAEIVFRLCLSSIYPTRNIKGDIFIMSNSMPTGFWMTIHFNCVRSSLQARYAWVRLRPSPLVFRDYVHQMTLGDDLIATVHPSCAWYNQPAIAATLEEIGAIATSATKSAELTLYDDPSTVQFLKRSFRMRDGVMVASIEEKTLIRMLCMRRTTQVSDKAAHATILSHVCAEAWMYGRERFEFYHSLCLALAEEHGLVGVPDLRIYDYNTYLSRYKNGSLITWNITDELI